jgi:hypothetical protein
VIDQCFLLWNCFQICQLSQRANECVCSCFLCGDGTFSLTLWVSQVFHSCSALRPYITHFDDIYKDFTTYKTSVPVTGAIILDESYQRVCAVFFFFFFLGGSPCPCLCPIFAPILTCFRSLTSELLHSEHVIAKH